MAGANAHAKLYALGEDKIEIIDKLLVTEPASKIAAMIHEEWGMLLDLKQESVKKMLERYRATHFKEKQALSVLGATSKMTAAEVIKKINAMDELTSLVVIQQGRLRAAMAKEAPMLNAGLLSGVVSDAIKQQKELLVELGKLQLETGVLARAPKKISGTVMGEDGRLTAFSWTEEQAKLYEELQGAHYIEG